MSEFKCLRFALNESAIDVAKYHREVVSRKTFASFMRSVVKVIGLQPQC